MDFAALHQSQELLPLQCNNLSIKHPSIFPFLASLHYDSTDEIESVCAKGNTKLD